jgi:hypothetical protein
MFVTQIERSIVTWARSGCSLKKTMAFWPLIRPAIQIHQGSQRRAPPSSRTPGPGMRVAGGGRGAGPCGRFAGEGRAHRGWAGDSPAKIERVGAGRASSDAHTSTTSGSCSWEMGISRWPTGRWWYQDLFPDSLATCSLAFPNKPPPRIHR